MKTTFLCVYNNEEVLNKSLLSSIEKVFPDIVNGNRNTKQSDLGLMLIDNKSGIYKSAAEAYNTVVRERKEFLGDCLIFLHQDIAFDNSDFLSCIINELTHNPNRILGPAGMCNNGLLYSNLRHREGGDFVVNNNIDYVKYDGIESLDECFVAIKKELFTKLWFDEKTCYHWHLYVADLCYNAKLKYDTEIGVFPNIIYHKEDNKGGVLTTNNSYLRTMWRMVNKYRKNVDHLYTSCCSTKTSSLGIIFTIIKYWIAQRVK